MVKVSKFQNELMKLLLLPKYETKIVRISFVYRAEMMTSSIHSEIYFSQLFSVDTTMHMYRKSNSPNGPNGPNLQICFIKLAVDLSLC